MTRAVRRRGASVLSIAGLLAVLLLLWGGNGGAACGGERIPVRRIPVDATAPETWPEGDWEPVALEAFESFLNGEDSRPPAGYLDRLVYVATLTAPDVMEGQAKGILRLHQGPDLIRLGQASFAMSSATVDQQQAAWGADAESHLSVLAPQDGAEFGFQWSLQGRRRSRGAEFRFEGLSSTSSRLELTAGPQGVTVEGGVVVERRANGDQTTYVIEMGARANCVLRIGDMGRSAAESLDCELHQIVSASPTKLVVQADIGILASETGPRTLSVPVDPGYSILRVMLPGGESLPFERGSSPGADLQISFPELTAGRKTVCRVVMEKPVDWSTAIDLPRVAPSNARLLRETWNVQFEKPLEVSAVEHPGFVQTGLTAEETREVWSFQGVQSERSLRILAGPPEPILDAVIVSRGSRADSRGEMTAVVRLTARRTRGFHCELEIQRPWTVVSIEAERPGGEARRVTWDIVREGEQSQFLKIDLPQSVGENAPVLLSVVAAAPAAAMDQNGFAGTIQPVVAGTIDRWVIAGDGDQTLRGDQESQWKASDIAEIPPELAKLALESTTTSGSPRVWRRLNGETAPTSAPMPAGANEPRPLASPPKDTSSSGPTVSGTAATAVIEVRMAEAGAREHLAIASFLFGQPTACGSWTLNFERAVSTIEVLGDDQPIEFAVDGHSLRLPAEMGPVRQLTVRYRVSAARGWLTTLDQVPLPAIPGPVSQWVCRLENAESRFIAEAPEPAAGASGLREISWTERWFGPLGRGADEAIFNPFRRESWSRLRGSDDPRQALAADQFPSDRPGQQVTAFGFVYPPTISVRTVWEQRFEWLCWAASIGALMTGLAIRRVVNAAYRTASIGAGIAATGALLGPAPWSALAGSVLFGIVAAFLIPRIFVRSDSTEPSPSKVRSSLILGRSATSSLFVAFWLIAMPRGWGAEGDPFDVLIPVYEEGTDEVAWVSPELRAKFVAWERSRQPLSWLIQDAQYSLTVSDQDAAPIEMRFELLSLTPDQSVQIPLLFEGVSFQSADSATLDGEPLRLTPLKGAQGIVIPLTPTSSSDSRSRPAPRVRRFELILRGQVRTTLRQGAAGLHLTVPSAGGARATVQFRGATPADFRCKALGHRSWNSELAQWSIGHGNKVSAVWKTQGQGQAESGRPGESEVLGRAETVVLIEAEYLRCRTRVTLESPESSDPFGEPRLRVLLPEEATVGAVTGIGVQGWLVEKDADSKFLWIDFDAAPAVPQEFDVEYILPRKSGTEFEIPALPLLAEEGLRSHQIALSASQSFQIRILTPADADAGIWDLAPSEAAFSLRRDTALALPQTAVELEIPQPLRVEMLERLVQRQAEIEQTLTPEQGRIRWEGYVRIETSGRSAFMHSLAIDPRIEIESVSVQEKDLNRLLRYVRQADRLLILLRDDVPGTQLVRLTGILAAPAQGWDAPPQLELLDARITRSEVVLNSNESGRFESRWDEGAADAGTRSTTDASSGQRVKIGAGAATPKFRWLPTRSNLTAEQYMRIVEEAGVLSAQIDWALAGDSANLRELEMDVPETAGDIEILGDYIEVSRRAYPHGGFRIRLAGHGRGQSNSRLSLRVSPRQGASLADAIPRLVELNPAPAARWVMAPIHLFERLDGGAPRLEALPPGAPADWHADFASGQYFALQSGSWRERSIADLSQEPLGTAMAQTVIAIDDSTIAGLTKILVFPARTGALTIHPPAEGQIEALWIDERPVETPSNHSELQGVAVLRSGLPVSVLIRWSSSHTAEGWGPIQPGLPTLDRFEAQRSLVLVESPTRWMANGRVMGSSQRAREEQKRRRESLLEAALATPSGTVLPAWMVGELQAFQRDSSTASATDSNRFHQLESVLEQQAALSSRAGEGPVSPPLARDGWTLFQASELLLASAAADPECAVMSRSQAALWLAPRSSVVSVLAGAWLLGFVLLLRRLLKLATRWQIADRLAERAGLTLLATGILWWLVLSPSVLGVALVAAVALYRALPRPVRRWHPPDAVRGL